jgi:predicted RNase H-like HicB family nuclease
VLCVQLDAAERFIFETCDRKPAVLFHAETPRPAKPAKKTDRGGEGLLAPLAGSRVMRVSGGCGGAVGCVSRDLSALVGSVLYNRVDMEFAISIQIEELPEGVLVATSDELSGLVAQGRTVAEALDIAGDVVRKLIEARRERESEIPFSAASAHHDYTIAVAV